MKALKWILVSIPVAGVLILASSSAYGLYVSYRTSDRQVEARCWAAQTQELMCWCYNEYARKCPGVDD